MCYTGGPYCYPHTRKKLEQATLALQEDPSDPDKRAAQQTAQALYDSTPQGIEELYQLVDKTENREQRAQLFDRLNNGKRLRAYQKRKHKKTQKALQRQAEELFLPLGIHPTGSTYSEYFQATNNKHFIEANLPWEEKAKKLMGASSQFDPYKTSNLQELLGNMWARNAQHLAESDDREIFAQRGGKVEDGRRGTRYLSTGIGGYGGVATMSELGDDYPVKMMEKIPGKPIIMFYVEGQKKWEKDGVAIMGRGVPTADNRKELLGNLITVFPADYPDNSTGMVMFDLPPKERQAKNLEVWEKAKEAIAQNRLTVGVLRDGILGQELRLPLASDPEADPKDVFFDFLEQKLIHSSPSSEEEYGLVMKDIHNAFGGCHCGSCKDCSRLLHLMELT